MAMDLRPCRRCKKIFIYNGNALCPACVQELDDMFVCVRNYIYEHPMDSMAQICENTGVEEAAILQMLREGRLSTSQDHSGLINCEKCGSPVSSGKYCDDCKLEMAQGLRDMLPQNKEQNPQTRTTGRDSKGMFVAINTKKE